MSMRKTRLIHIIGGPFWKKNVVLTELINIKTAGGKSENKTALSQADLILLSFDKFDSSKR